MVIQRFFSNGSFEKKNGTLTIEDFDLRFDEHFESHLLGNGLYIFKSEIGEERRTFHGYPLSVFGTNPTRQERKKEIVFVFSFMRPKSNLKDYRDDRILRRACLREQHDRKWS